MGLVFHSIFFRQFYQQRGLQIASSLAYATLLALVPLITVMFGFLGGLPLFENMGNTIQTYIFNNFVPAFGETVLTYLKGFSQKASQLTVTGLVMIFFIALMLMATIDNAFNSIWHIRNRRNPVARILVYWAILTMGPILLGVGMFSSSYLLSLPLISGVEASFGLKERLLTWLPFLTTSMAFTILYILIPNCFVLRRHALAGGGYRSNFI
ncbi:MAG: YihY family inner membrane protein [Gammaproteobacteria bacterium]|jgi:membrane protein